VEGKGRLRGNSFFANRANRRVRDRPTSRERKEGDRREGGIFTTGDGGKGGERKASTTGDNRRKKKMGPRKRARPLSIKAGGGEGRGK